MCLYPTLIKNPKYKPNKKNGGVIPAVSDVRVKAIPIGCGNCIECRKQKAREYQIRLLEDLRHKTYTIHKPNGIKEERKKERPRFITLTFNKESLRELTADIHNKKGYELDNEIATKAVRRYTERYRKKNKKALRHWLVTELGHTGTEHIHMHGIIWCNDDDKEIQNTWKYGYTWVGEYVNEKTVNYITKYVSKMDKQHKYYKPIVLTSHGIGAGYEKRTDAKLNKYEGENTRGYYTTRTGHRVSLPKYFKNKIYSEEEREQLWITMLDKNERYILGRKIDVKDGNTKYFKILDEARKKNKTLGYGTKETDWQIKEYEEQRRIMLQENTLTKARESTKAH